MKLGGLDSHHRKFQAHLHLSHYTWICRICAINGKLGGINTSILPVIAVYNDIISPITILSRVCFSNGEWLMPRTVPLGRDSAGGSGAWSGVRSGAGSGVRSGAVYLTGPGSSVGKWRSSAAMRDGSKQRVESAGRRLRDATGALLYSTLPLAVERFRDTAHGKTMEWAQYQGENLHYLYLRSDS